MMRYVARVGKCLTHFEEIDSLGGPLILLALLAVGGSSSVAAPTSFSWNTLNGQFNDSANWVQTGPIDLDGVPDANDIVTFRRGNIATYIPFTRVVYGAFLQADPTVGTLPPVSLVVLHPPSMPSGDAVDRWRAHAGERVVEILPVAAGSEAGRELDDAPLRLERGDAQAINAVVATARGDMLVFVAARAAPADAAWLARLAARALQPDIGCVGGVTFDATRRTARGGYILDRDIVATTAFAREPQGFVGMAGRNQIVQNLSAVCLSGLAVRRVTWEGAQGLDVVHLGSAYHDVDLCLRLAERGLQHVWHPGIVFVDERPLRVRQTPPLDAASDIEDAAYMRVRHRAILERDPAYNPNLSRPPRLFEIPDGDPADAALSPVADM